VRRAVFAFSCLAVAACASSDPGTIARPSQPAGWDQEVALNRPTDLAPAENVIEFNLDARVTGLTILPGTTTPAWTYDGNVPGPLIRARVGDRIIAHFTNHLPLETTVHWHGIRLPADQDGVPGHGQSAIPPGGSFDYSFVVPDAGLFWYHPHMYSAREAAAGLYGAILVEDAPAAAREQVETLGDDLVLVLSDMELGPDGALGDPNSGGDFGVLFGRQGNTMLVNGKVKPTIRGRAGLRQRWRIVNSATTRYYQLAMEGHTFTIVGVDGGFIERPRAGLEKIVVIPGGRADVIVEPTGAPGQKTAVRWVPYDRGYGTTFMIPEEDAFYLQLSDDAPYVEKNALPAQLRTIAPIDTSTAIARSISLTKDMVDGKLVMGIDGVPASMAQPMSAKVGTTEVWSVKNDMDFDHPFHLHGFFFQPLDSVTGAALASPEWLDTYNVPQHSSVKFAVTYDDRPGIWMFHCHILDHADAGMMGMLHLTN
jgi:FtsP/CotA-like multicopper oxidase with cupredoxin domain